ncbi:MAG: hypothetical protein AB1410_03670 [Acidobacteriota bacterium]
MKDRNRQRVIVLVFSVLLLIRNAFPQIIKTFSADFTREYIEGNKREVVEGKIYFQANSKRLIIFVTTPVRQWMVLSGNETLIFYPDSLKAFRIKMQIPSHMPFFEAFIGVMKDDYGLTKLGYTFSHYKRKVNTLVSYWKPPKNLAKIFGEYVLTYRDNRLIYAELKDAKSRIASKVEYSSHFFYGGTYFPLEVLITVKKEAEVISEKVIYKNHSFNSPLPSEVINFKIPEGTKIKEVQW